MLVYKKNHKVSLRADADRVLNSQTYEFYDDIMDINCVVYHFNYCLPLIHLRLMYALRFKSTSFLTKYGILNLDLDMECSYCNVMQPFTLFHLLFDCYCFQTLQNKYLQNFPKVPIDSIHTLFINMPKKEIFNLYNFLSGIQSLIKNFFS